MFSFFQEPKRPPTEARSARFGTKGVASARTSPNGRLFLPSFGAEIVQTFFEEAETIRRVGADWASRRARASAGFGSAEEPRKKKQREEKNGERAETKRLGGGGGVG